MLALTTEGYLNGKRFEKVPEHVTVLPWADLGECRGDFLRAARSICIASQVITLEPGEVVTLGLPGFEKQAQTVASDALQRLHRRLFSPAVELGLEFSNPEWLGDNYSPHITGTSLSRPLEVPCVTVIDNHEVDGKSRGMKTITQKLPFAAAR